jgi:hypothetical protein
MSQYVDFRQAYDNISRDKLYQTLHELQIPSELIRLIRMAMPDAKAQVKINAKLTEPFMIRRGLKHKTGHIAV